MSLLLNVLWILFGGGFAICLEYMLGGLILCCTIVGIPFGLQCFKLGELSLLPFGHEAISDPDSGGAGCLGTGLAILWFFVAGIWIFLTHVSLAIALGCTIIGIPFAIQHIKLAMLSLQPFGKQVVPRT